MSLQTKLERIILDLKDLKEKIDSSNIVSYEIDQRLEIALEQLNNITINEETT